MVLDEAEPSALAGSYERLFHEAGIPRLLLPLRTDLELSAALGGRISNAPPA